ALPFSGALAFSPDGKVLAGGRRPGGVQLWDLDAGKERATLPAAFVPTALAFAPGGKALAAAHAAGLKVWDLAGGKDWSAHLDGVDGVPRSGLLFAPDGQALATWQPGHDLRLWDAATGKERGPLEDASDVRLVAFSPDGKAV